MDMDRVDYLPCFLSEIGLLFRRKIVPLDVALVHAHPDDREKLERSWFELYKNEM